MNDTLSNRGRVDANRWRVRVSVATVLIVLVVLAGRLLQLQWIGRSEFAEQADRQRTYFETIPARPGDIVDRRGRLLATTIATQSLFVVPNRILHPRRLARRLSPALGLDPAKLFERLLRHKNKQFLWIKRRLSDEEAAAVRRLKLSSDVWGFRREYLRRYPQGSLAAHVVGLRDIDGKGQGGIEQGFDTLLRGQDGRRKLVRDAHGRVIDVREEVAKMPHNGQTVVLTLDAVIQLYAELELDRVMTEWRPASACTTVLDPQTGEVLAMASRPTYDPNRPGEAPLGKGGIPGGWKNGNISAVFEPGSTFKPFIVAWAIEQGVLKTDDVLFCENGAYRTGRRVLHDHHAYASLSVNEILVKSSNIGMAKIGERLGNQALYEATVAYGFGRRTGSGLPGELTGLVRPPESWNSYSTTSVPMGHEIAVTPLQLITAHAALANGGKLIAPRLLLRVSDSSLDDDDMPAVAPSVVQVVSKTVNPKISQWIVQGPLTDVVERGTGRKARLAGHTVFGKTGTTQKIDPASGTYSSSRHVSSFVCGAPAENPRVLVLVVVDDPSFGTSHDGGDVAAPAAARILKQALIHWPGTKRGRAQRSARR